MRKQTKRAAAVAVAAAMSVITGVSAVPSVAAVSSMMEVATASDARKKATESNAQPETIVSDLAPMEMQVATVSATGDLWNQWIGAKMDWLGSGTKSDPYKITGISELMGLSEAVAQGESFRGIYFELQNNIDLGDLNLNNGSWNPIGWFHNVSDLSGVPKAFEGTFDGAGNTI